MAGLLPVPLKDIKELPYTIQEWFRKINGFFTNAGFSWQLLDFSGSDLSDIVTRQHNILQSLQGGTTGEYYHLTATDYNSLVDGTYTPTLTNVANLTSSTAYSCQYMRIKNTVTVSGKVDITPTTTLTSTSLGISLPVASALTAENQVAGTAFCPAITGQGAAIIADATNDRATMKWMASDITAQSMFFTFTYRVL